MLLQDVQTELDLAYNRLKGDDSEDRKQEKIDKLSAQVFNINTYYYRKLIDLLSLNVIFILFQQVCSIFEPF
jgi:hypothetical protein